MKHAKVTTTTPQPDGSIIIESESYYDKLAHAVKEIERQSLTSRGTVLSDIIHILEHITKDNSPKVTITIMSKNNEPIKIIERWTEYKQDFK